MPARVPRTPKNGHLYRLEWHDFESTLSVYLKKKYQNKKSNEKELFNPLLGYPNGWLNPRLYSIAEALEFVLNLTESIIPET